MTGKGDGLAAFLAQVHPKPPVLDVDVFDPHRGGGPDPGEGVDHQPDQRPVAQARMGGHVDAVEQLSRFLGGRARASCPA